MAMRLRAVSLRPPLQPRIYNTSRLPSWSTKRGLMTLAIETSCDDTSVAVVEKAVQNGRTMAWLHFHKKVTSNNLVFQGVHPLASLRSHQENLAALVDEAIARLPTKGTKQTPIVESSASGQLSERRLPDFISVTRGPGMRSNLFTGLDTAKGLAVAWQIPLVGIHHMQAHALTPRLVGALEAGIGKSVIAGSKESCTDDHQESSGGYPFLSVLASGGHTMLIKSSSLSEHIILGNTNDIAIGDCLDKAARAILPADILQNSKTTMYASLLEPFAIGDEIEGEKPPNQTLGHATAETYFEAHKERYKDEASEVSQQSMQRTADRWGWSMAQPLSKASGGIKHNTFEMSFSGLTSAAERLVRYGNDPLTGKTSKNERPAGDVSLEERKDMALEVMRASFEHVASRVVMGLQSFQDSSMPTPSVVVAGGVAANSFFRYLLAKTLCARGFTNVVLHFPPVEYCTDNAAMIGWAGIEMFEAGHRSPLDIRAIRKWPLDQLMNPQNDG